MRKIQFDLQTWLKDKSQKVVTRKDNIPVKIICTDCNSCQPIVALVPTIDGKEETVETYCENGKYFNNNQDANLDLFIVTEDEPITEFENGVIETILAGRTIVGNIVDPRYAKTYAEKLLYLAKEQLKQEGWEYTDPLLKESIADAEKKKFANEIIAEYKRVWDLLPDADKDSFTTEETIMYGKFMELETLYDKFCEPIGVTLEEEEKQKESNIDKLHKISTPADENWFEIQKQWEKEDEDEVIRKDLIDYLWGQKIYYESDEVKMGDSQKCRLMIDGIAWLEKQKEIPTNEEMLRTLHLEYEKGVADTIAKYEQKEQKPENVNPKMECDNETDVQKAYREGRTAGIRMVCEHPEEYRLQKPAEWSEEDGKTLQFILDFFTNCWWNKGWEISREQVLGLLKSLKPQPKVEWSEEDEDMLSIALQCLVGTPYSQGTKDKVFHWFKSLKNRGNFHSWKPSEEQMDSLRNTIIATKGYNYSVFLPELYEQLKKLKEG